MSQILPSYLARARLGGMNPMMRSILKQAALDETGWNIRSSAESLAASVIVRAGFHPPEVQHQFRIEKYRLDFAWPAILVALEIDGPHHFAPYQAAQGRLRDHQLRELGWLVFHIDADEPVVSNQIQTQLSRVLRTIHGITRDGI